MCYFTVSILESSDRYREESDMTAVGTEVEMCATFRVSVADSTMYQETLIECMRFQAGYGVILSRTGA